ncbi:3-phytase [Hephaestia caeni]|uniref:3-phytase n=1 Tax=Hephaestia caeni TaxID=645617 RepID=A0A397PC96_9SPHN|nr:phytase [Hephaestia caeni]RIA45569.1 3-phytase [Hephaestia caeni]
MRLEIMAIVPLALLGGCVEGRSSMSLSPAPTVAVTAVAETEAVATRNADAADDPAIWRNAGDPQASLIVATDKKAGLYVYGLDGAKRSFIDAGRVNNVDLRDDVRIGGRAGILVVASDRSDPAHGNLALFRLDPVAARLEALGKIPALAGEAYGLCLYRAADALYAFLVMKDGTIGQIALDLEGATPQGRLVRTLHLASQAEGCVADDRSGRLYVAEEDVGIWRFDAGAAGPVEATAVAKVDRVRLFDDVEGLAIVPEGADGGYLVASSQGDNAYAVWQLVDEEYVGRFRIEAGAVDGTQETDGIEIAVGDFGPAYPRGLLVAQDGDNAPAAQNFKLVSWADVERALGRHPSERVAPE